MSGSNVEPDIFFLIIIGMHLMDNFFLIIIGMHLMDKAQLT